MKRDALHDTLRAAIRLVETADRPPARIDVVEELDEFGLPIYEVWKEREEQCHQVSGHWLMTFVEKPDAEAYAAQVRQRLGRLH